MLGLAAIKDIDSARTFMLALLNEALILNAEDTFITAEFPPCFKINGKLAPQGVENLTKEQAKLLVLSIMSAEQFSSYIENKEVNFAISLNDKGRFRVNAYQQKSTYAMVLRKINTIIPGLEELNLPSSLGVLSLEQRGLILVVGHTGSGKSTSLAAMINYRNQNFAGHILSIEDPIEFIHHHQLSIVSQREVGVDTKNWGDGIKSAMRQAPDAILIGEIRDLVALEYALQLAETGHLCLATLHATDCTNALKRIIDLCEVDKQHQIRINLALNLKAVIAQRLIPSLNKTTRIPAVELLINRPLA